MQSIKNIAIIAHVDHGKTTLVDKLLTFSASIDAKENSERVMDSGDIERERGITILSKNTAIEYQGKKINILDTPGHSDFGGEVERVLKMVDVCLLLVDAREGPMPQTRFVLKKALDMGHKVILVINKIDRPNVDIPSVIDKTFELFLELNANDSQIDFPVIYSSAKNGYALKELTDEPKDIQPLLDLILAEVPDAQGDVSLPLQFQVTTLDYNEYLGRICIGRVFQGSIRVGDTVALVGENDNNEQVISQHKITKLFTFLGLKRIEAAQTSAGDIIAIAGIPELTIGDTLCQVDNIIPMPRIEIEPPTVSMTFLVNDSPFAGKEGKYVTSRNIRERLNKEIKTNLSLRIQDLGDSFKVSGRGELQLAILVENMRREGFELGVSKPSVILKEENEQKLEPYEEIVMDLPETYSGTIIQELNRRKGQMTLLENLSEGFVRLKFEIPTRGFIGFRSFFITETRGEGSLSSLFLEYRPFSGAIGGRARGAIISMENGVTTTYALYNAQERGELFVGPQTSLYVGMIIGLHAKETDLEVNPVREKKLTNMRASGSDETLKLTPHKILSLEQAMDFLDDDEILEITPESLRLRKKVLNPSMRKKKTG